MTEHYHAEGGIIISCITRWTDNWFNYIVDKYCWRVISRKTRSILPPQLISASIERTFYILRISKSSQYYCPARTWMKFKSRFVSKKMSFSSQFWKFWHQYNLSARLSLEKWTYLIDHLDQKLFSWRRFLTVSLQSNVMRPLNISNQFWSYNCWLSSST